MAAMASILRLQRMLHDLIQTFFAISGKMSDLIPVRLFGSLRLTTLYFSRTRRSHR